MVETNNLIETYHAKYTMGDNRNDKWIHLSMLAYCNRWDNFKELFLEKLYAQKMAHAQKKRTTACIYVMTGYYSNGKVQHYL